MKKQHLPPSRSPFRGARLVPVAALALAGSLSHLPPALAASGPPNGGPTLDPQTAFQRTDRLFFIENKGQWHQEVLYLARLGGLDAWITRYGVNYTFYKVERKETERSGRRPRGKFDHEDPENSTLLGHRVIFELEGHNPSPALEGMQKQEGYYNYFIGNDPSRHATHVSLYKEALVKDVYPGIDLRYYFDRGFLRYDFVVHPGADPAQIRFNLKGQDADEIKDNKLVYTTRFGEVQMAELRSYQSRGPVQSRLMKQGDAYAIALGRYDNSTPLIIDPLVYSTYIGGSDWDFGYGIAVDGSGQAYVTGRTASTDYDVTPGAFQTSYGGNFDVFVTKLNASGTGLMYSTYIGGSSDDVGNVIAVDGSGQAYVTGYTHSADYDVTSGAFQTSHGGGFDVFVTKLNASGTALMYSTYIGGSGDDVGRGIAVDGSGQAYVTGSTASTDYDVTAGAFQTSHGGFDDVIVTKLNASGSGLAYSTYIGGSLHDYGLAITIDPSGQAYVTGYTASSDYDVTPGAFQTSHGGGLYDVFVTKLNASGTALMYSTYIGGSGYDAGFGTAVDGSGQAYVTGRTASTDYDVTPGAFQTSYGGGTYDAFMTKLNASGTALSYSTYIGGSNWDDGYDIAVDGSWQAYVAGNTASTDYDVTPGAFQTSLGGGVDVFVTKLNASGTALSYSTYIGGSSDEVVHGIAVDGSGQAYVTGWTASTDYDVTPGAFQTSHGGGGVSDVFVTKLNPCPVSTFYQDADGDGYGNPAASTTACTAPSGYVSNNTDCNDGNAAVHPGATEICNGIDDNCNGIADDLYLYYPDSDGDGYGAAGSSPTYSCSSSPPPFYSANNTDCNDANAAIHPGATELCNGIDDNCNGIADDLYTYYADDDGDGYGATTSPPSYSCSPSPPPFYASNNTDCNDSEAGIHPGATELCNGMDDNCNGIADDLYTYYADDDGDGYGATTSPPSYSCDPSPPPSFSASNNDCNDANDAIHPGATETCNEVDDDCDGTADDGLPPGAHYNADIDGDGYGNPGFGADYFCGDPGAGWAPASLPEDCNEFNASVHPGATETCNGLDDDCNGIEDDLYTYYADDDDDGFGSMFASPTYSCDASPPPLFSVNNTDCNDGNAFVYPGATELCNGMDDDCDGTTDEGVLLTFYQDADSDGYGNPAASSTACSAPSGYVSDNTDCNDSNAAVHPGASETCNGIDDDCDGTVDDGVASTFYQDADSDGYGNPAASTTACTAPSGYVSDNTDCNDGNALQNPATVWYLDADNDGYWTGSGITQCASPGTGYKFTGLTAGGDCNDGNAAINPGATEDLCNGMDDNCNGSTDEGAMPNTALQASDCSTTAANEAHVFHANAMAGAVQYEFEFNDGTNTYNEIRPNRAFYFALWSWDMPGTTYSVRVRWFNGTMWSCWGPACSITSSPMSTTKLDAAACGATATTPAHVFHAIAMAGATQYEFSFDDGTNTYYEVRPNRAFYFGLFSWDTYGTTYTVKVRWFDGVNWSAWGLPCSLTNSSSATTQLDAASCGVAATSPAHVFRAIAMPGATQYEFEFSDGVNTYYELRPNRGFYFSLFTWDLFSTTYTVKVRWHDGTAWSEWGPPCNVTSSPMSTTQLQTGDCGATVTSAAQVLRANAMAGADLYEFKLSDGINTSYLPRPNRGTYMLLFGAGPWPAGSYTMEVRWRDAGTGTWSDWGPVCSLTLPAPLNDNAIIIPDGGFDVKAFPVPFGDVVNLTVETFSSEPVHVTVTDVNGRVVEDRRVQMEHNGLLTLGESWANGVYMLRVQQGAEVRTLRVVKAQQ